MQKTKKGTTRTTYFIDGTNVTTMNFQISKAYLNGASITWKKMKRKKN
jgi:hypothetical protein